MDSRSLNLLALGDSENCFSKVLIVFNLWRPAQGCVCVYIQVIHIHCSPVWAMSDANEPICFIAWPLTVLTKYLNPLSKLCGFTRQKCQIERRLSFFALIWIWKCKVNQAKGRIGKGKKAAAQHIVPFFHSSFSPKSWERRPNIKKAGGPLLCVRQAGHHWLGTCTPAANYNSTLHVLSSF